MALIAPSASRVCLLVLLSVALFVAALAGACASPEPTATPTPTATATPTATPTPTPASVPAATPAAGGEVLGRDLLAMFTEEEQSCVRERLGDAVYEQLLQQPVGGSLDGMDALETFLGDCLSPEGFAGIAVFGLSTAIGGMTPGSSACLRAFFIDTGTLEPPSELTNDREDILLAFRFFLCLTDDEAQRLASLSGGEDGMPLLPSGVRCVDDKIGLEAFADALAGDPSQAPEEAAEVLRSCGVDFFPLPSSGEGGEGAFNQVSLIWLQYDPELQALVDCLRDAASEEELDAFFSGSSADPPPAIPACLDMYADLLPSAGALG